MTTINLAPKYNEITANTAPTPLYKLLRGGDTVPKTYYNRDKNGEMQQYCNLKNISYHPHNKKWRVVIRYHDADKVCQYFDTPEEALFFRMEQKTPARAKRGAKKSDTVYEDGHFKAKCSQIGCTHGKAYRELCHFVPAFPVGFTECFHDKILRYDKLYDDKHPECTTLKPREVAEFELHRDRTAECKTCRDKASARQKRPRDE